VLTFILRILAALFMRASWSASTKGLVLLVLATVTAFLKAWICAVNSGEHFDVYRVLYADLINFGIAVVSYVGLLKNTPVQRSTLNSGPVKDRTINSRVVR
jgi:hypothetical protein